jgi:hypothetical protein
MGNHVNYFDIVTSMGWVEVSHMTCWQPIQFFQLPYKLPTPLSSELQIIVAFCK